ncbi:hypothetical protein BHE74_00052390 [Ensete ventricosum]|nr:hypothetical protein BHE74_00052390 [Ensete ventricosum]
MPLKLVKKTKLLDFARLLEVVLYASSWLLVFACSLLTLLKHPKCLAFRGMTNPLRERHHEDKQAKKNT